MSKESKFKSAMLHSGNYEVPESKKCNLCHEYLPISDFNVNHKNMDGHSNACRKCAGKKAYERTKRVREERRLASLYLPI